MHCSRLSFIWFAALLGFSPIASGQTPLTRQITTQDGLPDNEVYDMIQATDGAMWFATNLGICRYNGREFTYYDLPTPRSKSVTGLHQDQWGRIWMYNFFGEVFYWYNEQLVPFAGFSANMNANNLFMAWHPSNRSFVLSCSVGVYAYSCGRKANGEWLDSLQTMLPISASSPAFDQLGNCWMMTANANGHETVTKLRDGKVTTFSIAYSTASKSRIKLPVFIKNEPHLIDKFDQTLYKLEGNVFNSTAQLDGLPFTNNATYNRLGQLQLLTRRGAFGLSEDNRLKPILTQFGAKNSSKTIEDQEGNVWMSTIDAGVFVAPNIPLTRWDGFEATLGTNDITSITTGPNASLFVGTQTGVIGQFFPRTGKIQRVHATTAGTAVSLVNYLPTLSMLFWQSNISHLMRLTPSLRILATPTAAATKAVFELDNGSFGMATSTGLEVATVAALANGDGISSTSNLSLSLKRMRSAALNGGTNQLWAASRDGVERFASEKQVGNVTINNQPIYATTLASLPRGILAGTVNQGLLWYEGNQLKAQIKIAQGLLSNTVLALVVRFPLVWLRTDKGVQMLNLENLATRNLTLNEGLPTSQINGLAWLDSTLYLATPAGLVAWHYTQPERYGNSSNTLVINQILVNGNPSDSLGLLSLQHFENNLLLRVERPSYKARLAFVFRHKFNDGAWSENNDGIIQFEQLKPGRYNLMIEAVTSSGRPICLPVMLNITIAPPFWQRWWWYTVLALAALLVAALTFRQVLKRTKKKELLTREKLALSEALKRSMLTSIKAQMNPHFIFNALNTIQSFIYSNSKAEANAYLAKFSRLMRMVLDMSNTETVLLSEEISALTLYLELEQMRFEDSLEFSLSLAESLPTNNIRVPSMIIQPFVENAIKHGLLHRKQNRQLSLNFEHLPLQNLLRVIIDDNGVGRKQSHLINQRRADRHTSFSSTANQQRLELLNTGKMKPIGIRYVDKTDSVGHALGTTVVLEIPC